MVNESISGMCYAVGIRAADEYNGVFRFRYIYPDSFAP